MLHGVRGAEAAGGMAVCESAVLKFCHGFRATEFPVLWYVTAVQPRHLGSVVGDVVYISLGSD